MGTLNITDVRIKKIFKEAKPKDTDKKSVKRAIASVTYCGGSVVTHDIEIWDGENGLYIQFPHTKRFITNKNKEKEEIVYNVTHPIKNDARNEFSEAILAEFTRRMEGNDK